MSHYVDSSYFKQQFVEERRAAQQYKRRCDALELKNAQLENNLGIFQPFPLFRGKYSFNNFSILTTALLAPGIELILMGLYTHLKNDKSIYIHWQKSFIEISFLLSPGPSRNCPSVV